VMLLIIRAAPLKVDHKAVLRTGLVDLRLGGSDGVRNMGG